MVGPRVARRGADRVRVRGRRARGDDVHAVVRRLRLREHGDDPAVLVLGHVLPALAVPAGLQSVIRCTPLYQGVVLERSLVLGDLHWTLLLNAAYLVVMGLSACASPRGASAYCSSRNRSTFSVVIRRLFKNLGVLDPTARPRSRRNSNVTVTRTCAACFDADDGRATPQARSTHIRDDPARAVPRRQGRVPLRDAQPQRRVPGRGDAPRILEVIEPLLGEDCHVIANTAWRNPPDFEGGPWHCDAGPHVPRRRGRPVGRPHPVSRSSRSRRTCYLAGLHPRPTGRPRSSRGAIDRAGSRPFDRMVRRGSDLRRPSARAVFEAAAGDVVLFVSDAWHRGLPARAGGHGAATSSRCTTPAATSRSASARPRSRNQRLAGGDRPRDDRAGAHGHRTARPVLLRRLTLDARAGSRRCR